MNFRRTQILYKSPIRIVLFLLAGLPALACNPGSRGMTSGRVTPGAYRTEIYVPQLEGRRIGIVANHTSLIHNTHVVDSLLSLGLNVVRVFGPEHGFRGRAEAGESVHDGKDLKTGLQVISLYGRNRRPSPEVLSDLDIIVFDLQDVGARFFTYISTLSYLMEVCARNNIAVMVLDRPNPNGFYVDGPVLEPDFSSFVGLHPIPVVFGMTIGEYARMVNGEGWLQDELKCNLTVIPCGNYTHQSMYELPVPPSPNLPTMNAVYLYPSTCFFEGTSLSEGRGTDAPFEIFGHPDLKDADFTFIPESRPGFSSHPKLEGQLCYGIDLRSLRGTRVREPGLNLTWLIDAYNNFPDKDHFFTDFFENLTGTASLRQQIIAGKSEEEIRKSWQPGLERFRRIRAKYLIYGD